jgi:hypothetical protein
LFTGFFEGVFLAAMLTCSIHQERYEVVGDGRAGARSVPA